MLELCGKGLTVFYFSVFLFLSPSLSSVFFISLSSSRWWGSDFSRWDISRYMVIVVFPSFGTCIYLCFTFRLLLSVLACVTFPALKVYFTSLFSKPVLYLFPHTFSRSPTMSYRPSSWCCSVSKSAGARTFCLWCIAWSVCCYSDHLLAIGYGCYHCWHFCMNRMEQTNFT